MTFLMLVETSADGVQVYAAVADSFVVRKYPNAHLAMYYGLTPDPEKYISAMMSFTKCGTADEQTGNWTFIREKSWCLLENAKNVGTRMAKGTEKHCIINLTADDESSICLLLDYLGQQRGRSTASRLLKAGKLSKVVLRC
jgi:hypothetical protein